MVFNSSLFWQSMGNTALFAAVAVVARLVIGMALALALHTRLIRHRSLVPHFILPAHHHPDGGGRFRMEIHV